MQRPLGAIAVITAILALALLQLDAKPADNLPALSISTVDSPRPAVRPQLLTSNGVVRRSDEVGSAAVSELGRRTAYKLVAERVFTVGDHAPQRLRLNGTWAETVVGRDEGHTQVLIEVDEPELGQVRCFLSRAADGRVEALWFYPGTTDGARGLIAALAAAMQRVSDDGQDTWETEETDLTGDYVARYRRTEAGVQKKKLRYVRLVTADGMAPVTSQQAGETTGEATFLLKSDGLHAAHGSDSMLAELGDTALSVSATWSVDRLFRERRPDLVGAFQRDYSRLAMVTATEAPAQTARPRGPRVAGVLAALTDVDAHENPDRTRATLASALGAAVQADPAAAEQVLRRVQAGDPETSTLLNGLAVASTPAAQKALATVAQDGALSRDVRAQSVVSLALTSKPTGETVTALSELVDDHDADVADTAALALGSAAGETDQAEAADEAVQLLLQRYDEATTPPERTKWLLALGNTADARILPAIIDGLSRTLVVHVAAVQALRLVDAPEARALIIAAMIDPEPQVRIAAVFAGSYQRGTALLERMMDMLREDPEERVRAEAARVLSRHVEQHPEIAALLAREGDPEGAPQPH